MSSTKLACAVAAYRFHSVAAAPRGRWQMVPFSSSVCVLAKTGGVTCRAWKESLVPELAKPHSLSGMEHATVLAGGTRLGIDPLTGLLCAIVEGGAVACATLGSAEVDLSHDAERMERDERRANAIGPVTRVPSITGATRIAVDAESACAETPSGVWCWGQNDDGQLGDGTRIDRAIPVRVAHLLDDVLPPPVIGNDAVPESAAKMSWAGLPPACMRPTTVQYPGRHEEPTVSWTVISAYAEWDQGELEVRLASYQTEPTPTTPDPRGTQRALRLLFEKEDRDGNDSKADRGRYVIGDGEPRRLRISDGSSSGRSDVLAGNEVADLKYVDTHWACGTFEYQSDPGGPITRWPFAARIVK